VGVEVLVGAALGVLTECYFQVVHALQWRYVQGGTLDIFFLPVLKGLRDFLGVTLSYLDVSLITAATMAVMVTAFLLIVRNRMAACILVFLSLVLVADTRGSLATALVITGGMVFVQIYLLMRVGIVALVIGVFIANAADRCGWPHDFSSWMLPETLWTLALILAVAGVGFWLAIGRQNPFGNFRLED
jgi:hypothetical protein